MVFRTFWTARNRLGRHRKRAFYMSSGFDCNLLKFGRKLIVKTKLGAAHAKGRPAAHILQALGAATDGPAGPSHGGRGVTTCGHAILPGA